MPGVFTDQHRRATPRRIKRANLEAAVDESFLVEHPVCRQEELAMHMADYGLVASQRHIERAIIEGVVPHLVEPNAHIECPRCSNCGSVLRLKVPGKGARRQGDIAYAPFDEIAGERGLSEDGYIGTRVQ